MAFCHWVWRLDPCKHCGSPNVELMYLGSKNRLDGAPDSSPITRCRDCGKWSNMPIEGNKGGNKMDNLYKCPNCGSENFSIESTLSHIMPIAPHINCHNCGYKGLMQKTVSTDKLAEFMEAVINISKSLNKNIDNNSLKSCPYCGDPAKGKFGKCKNDDGEEIVSYWVHCEKCGLHTPFCISKEESIRLWNSIEIDKYED